MMMMMLMMMKSLRVTHHHLELNSYNIQCYFVDSYSVDIPHQAAESGNLIATIPLQD